MARQPKPKKHSEVVDGVTLQYNDSEMVNMKFNMTDPRDKAKWMHVKKQGNLQSYLKDLILLDMQLGLLDGNILERIGSARGNKSDEADPKTTLVKDEVENKEGISKEDIDLPDLEGFDGDGAFDFDL